MGAGSSKEKEITMKGSPEEEKRVQDDQNAANAAQDKEKMEHQIKELQEEINTETNQDIKREKTIRMLKKYITRKHHL